MRRPILIAAAIAALAVPGVAEAGCMATAGLAPPPDTLTPGQAWAARVTVMQHGVRPLPGLEPTVTIVNDTTGASRQFVAKPTRKTGTYLASVTFPSAGTYSYQVWDGFVVADGEPMPCAQTHTFPAVSVGPNGTTPAGPGPTPPAPPAPAQVAPTAADDGGPGVGVFLALVLGGIAVAAAAGVGLAHRMSKRHARHAGA